ncbi:hypothetical protein ACH4LZ_06040 [Streptomyces halstedii]|uniref:hypothetical protein n=1 Tax=Streptomyces halstedii TaxID=1944 RepID=UPI0037AE27FB
MDDSTRIWITPVPPFGPDESGVLLGVDLTSEDPAERMAGVLLNRGHEGQEGVFHLLASDLSARYERHGERLAVEVTASRQVLAHDLADHPDALDEHLPALPGGPGDDDRVTLIRREMVTGFRPAGSEDGKQPVLLVEHEGPTTLAELFARFDRGESGFAVLPAD